MCLAALPLPALGSSPARGARLGLAGMEGTLAPCLALHRAACASLPCGCGWWDQPSSLPGALVDT